MNECSLQYSPPTPTPKDSLWERLRSLESDQTNADTKGTLDLARARVVTATERAKGAKQEMACTRQELSEAIRGYQNCQRGHRGEWSQLRDVIAFEFDVSTRSFYRVLALSGAPVGANGKARALGADHTNLVEDMDSTTSRLKAQANELVSRRLKRKSRLESNDDFTARIVAEFAARTWPSTAVAVQLVRELVQASGLGPFDFQRMRVACE